jgi:DNA mismatch endonuclease, patch repair protein
MTPAIQSAGREPRRRSYLRDGRAPVPLNSSTSEVMRANRARATGPELAVRELLESAGLTTFQTNPHDLPGRPDIAFPAVRLAVFVHGCFWHQCPHCTLPLPRSHTEFWVAKFRANKLRDARKARALRRNGWSVLTVWECQIRDSPDRVANRIARAAQV